MIPDTQNPEQLMILDLVKNTNECFHVAGKAGTGKTELIRYIKENIPKKNVVVAPTGVAALQVGGFTIHSRFQFPNRLMLGGDSVIRRFKPSSEKRKMFEEMDVLIIDEVPMVSANLIDAIDCSLRRNTGLRNIPFGGKQVIFVGDLFQLKPVITDKDKALMDELHPKGFYFYNSEVFETLKLHTIELKKVYRQDKIKFVDLLDRVKLNCLEPDDLAILNSRLRNSKQLFEMEYAITLTTTNKMANNVNIDRLSQLHTEEYRYFASVSGIYDSKNYPTDSILNLKVDAQIIFSSNDKEKRWVNGTVGIIHELTKRTIKVKLENGSIHEVKKETWQNYEYIFDYLKFSYKPKAIGKFKQFPLKLAWAMTIHRAQGKTFQKVIIDFGTKVFEHGQVYVALSRVTSLGGLFLKRPIRPDDIFVDPEILSFVSNINNEASYKRLKELSELGSKRWHKNNLG